MPIPTDNYSKEMFRLLDMYYQTDIWRKYNWYDFLEKLTDIINKYKNK
jgi:hypothetical protein